MLISKYKVPHMCKVMLNKIAAKLRPDHGLNCKASSLIDPGTLKQFSEFLFAGVDLRGGVGRGDTPP